ncbi:MAG: zinc metalloprotease [Saprospiraceae bacterium]|nr:zinc metalloprotease [Saprospiraceae bacterium]
MDAIYRHITTTLLTCLAAAGALAQGSWCGVHDLRLHAASAFDSTERLTQQSLDQYHRPLHTRSTITIPVVFHVVYSNEEENVSDLQIRSQLAVLNRDFNGLSENRGIIPASFRASVESAGIRFCLASTDPAGNPTTGITRTGTSVTGIGGQVVAEGRIAVHYDAFGGKNAWDPERYINVWVADLNGLLGKATFPGMAEFPEEDGVIIDPSVVGALGTAADNAPYDRGHTLTHELGHYFGLLHLWGTTADCSDDDLVADTPQQAGPYSGCPSHPQHSCGSDDMFMNFMALTDDRCLAFFTAGQVARMQAALMTHRPGLLTADMACLPIASGRTPLDSIRAFYAPGDQMIIVHSNREYDQPVTIELLTASGRLILSTVWSIGSTFWIDASDWPGGIYALVIRNGESRKSRLLAIY